jgi:light-regulated signal transduction histidine kinase (bacteriophytochrome)
MPEDAVTVDGIPAAMPPAEPPPPAPPRRTPRLGQIFTAEQLREYNRAVDESLDRVRRVLGRVAGRNLNPELTDIVSRIQTFQKQAEQARDQDLVTAVNLARRADLLAQDLIKRLP